MHGSDEQIEHALGLAYGYLDKRDRTQAEVRRRLEQRGVGASTVDAALQTLIDLGVLDDARFARLFVEDKRGLEQWGNERIRRTLTERGIDRELIEQSLAVPDHDETELDRALALLRRRFPDPPRDRRERERALGVLLAKGVRERACARRARRPHTRRGRGLLARCGRGLRAHLLVAISCRPPSNLGKRNRMIELGTGRRAPLRAAVLVALATLSLAAVASGAAGVVYSGQTSQQRPISFTLTSNQVKGLKYHIDDRCPRGKSLFVNAWGFPALQIKNAKFGGKFVAKAPQNATAIVTGTVAGSTIRGTLSDQTIDHKTHKLCSGKATFSLTHQRHKRGSDG